MSAKAQLLQGPTPVEKRSQDEFLVTKHIIGKIIISPKPKITQLRREFASASAGRNFSPVGANEILKILVLNSEKWLRGKDIIPVKCEDSMVTPDAKIHLRKKKSRDCLQNGIPAEISGVTTYRGPGQPQQGKPFHRTLGTAATLFNSHKPKKQMLAVLVRLRHGRAN